MTTEAQQPSQILSIRASARRMGYSYRHVRRLIATGRIAARNVNAGLPKRPTWAIDAKELARFEAERGVRGRAS